VLEVQLIDALPEHFNVGGEIHGRIPPYRHDDPSIDLSITKDEMGAGIPTGARAVCNALFIRIFEMKGRRVARR
jgi:hypothetical protein